MKGSRPLTDREIGAVARKLSARDRALFILGICSGFRISELLSLRICDVEKDGKVASSVYVARKSMKGKMEGRTIPLALMARKAIGVWLKILRLKRPFQSMDAFLFSSRIGSGAITRSQAWRILTQAFSGNGLTGKLGTHAMRKTFAARIYERLDHDLLKTQRALGHQSVNSTVAYLSFAESDINKAVLQAWG